jgi:FkbM family methyltransferase
VSFLKNLIRAFLFPFYSAFSSRTGLCFFFPTSSGWRAWTRGQTFPVPYPRLEALEYFRHFVPRKSSVVFDVGGELGLETRQFAQMVGPEGRVFVFECLPNHVQGLKDLSERYPQVSVIERACWDQSTTLEFFVGKTPGSSTVVPDARGQQGQALADMSQQKLQVQAERLDDLWKRLHDSKPVEFLKMDIEGAEYEALDGAQEMLKHTKYAAIAAYHIRDGVRTADKVAEQLRKAGFQVRIDENHHVYGQRKVS